MKLTLEEEQFILNRRKKEEIKKPRKIGCLKHDLFIIKESVNTYSLEGEYFDELRKNEIIKDFLSRFELVSEAGSEYDGFIDEDGSELWYDREYGISRMPANWAQKNLINIRDLKRNIMNKTIYFYTTKDQHGYMSNFARYAIKINDKKYMTSEHYYQSQKAIGTDFEKAIADAANPKSAATLGRSNLFVLREDWDQVKDDVMRIAVEAKFRQNPDIKEKLLNTGNAKLVEDTTTTNDCYWGCGTGGSGKNMLGIILMEMREKFRNE